MAIRGQLEMVEMDYSFTYVRRSLMRSMPPKQSQPRESYSIFSARFAAVPNYTNGGKLCHSLQYEVHHLLGVATFGEAGEPISSITRFHTFVPSTSLSHKSKSFGPNHLLGIAFTALMPADQATSSMVCPPPNSGTSGTSCYTETLQ